MEPPAEPHGPCAVPWRYALRDPEGRWHVGERWARPSASARDIAEELLAVLAHKVLNQHGSHEPLERCVAMVGRPAFEGWPAEFDEVRGSSWLMELAAPNASRRVSEAA